MSRIEECFQDKSRTKIIAFLTGGDPDDRTCLSLLQQLPTAGVDCLELGMPFSDPTADGPTIQASSQRALEAGASLPRTLALIEAFRRANRHTPILLMGYYNPIYRYGRREFLAEAFKVGVDGLIVVDLPLEADTELCLPAQEYGIDFIRLITPASDDDRVEKLVRSASGFGLLCDDYRLDRNQRRSAGKNCSGRRSHSPSYVSAGGGWIWDSLRGANRGPGRDCGRSGDRFRVGRANRRLENFRGRTRHSRFCL